ncbi:hypothetical protein EON76_04260 [bacterium]|nr:MAG: hypothetical protein EON76_04260 [bacterium]
MSKKDVAKSKPAKAKDKAKKMTDAAPNLDTIREETAKAKAEDTSIMGPLNEAHAAVDKAVTRFDMLVESTENYEAFAEFAQRIEEIVREVEAGREALAAAEMKRIDFEVFLDNGVSLSQQYGFEETIKSVAKLLDRIAGTAGVHDKSLLDEFRAGKPTYGTLKVPTFPSEVHPLDIEPSGGWADGVPG